MAELRKCIKCQQTSPATREFYALRQDGEFTLRCIMCLTEEGCICTHQIYKSECSECKVQCDVDSNTRTCVKCEKSFLLNNTYFARRQDNSFTLRCFVCLIEDGSMCKHLEYVTTCPKGCAELMQCEHDKLKTKCKICSDPIPITIQNMLSGSRQADKKREHYDQEKFVDYNFLLGLIKRADGCYYCNIPMQYVKNTDDMGTIERLDNSMGHNKDNTVIACLSCNRRRVGNRVNIIVKKRKRVFFEELSKITEGIKK